MTSTTSPACTTVPLNTLVEGAGINARRTEVGIEGLMRSIANHGLLIPLLVRNTDNGKGSVVIAGNRRLACLQTLAKHKHDGFSPTMPVPVIVREEKDGAALELSLVENIDREDLHPVDQFEVYSELVASGHTVEGIAQRRGMTVKEVRQALALGRLAPEVREAWRLGKISAESAEAFTLTSDHKAQAAALKKIGKNHISAWSVRRQLTGEDRVSQSTMLKIVGRAEYEKAGHEINPTLFADRSDDKETVSDIVALKAMVAAKLEAHCETLKKEGWAWAVTSENAPKDISAWRRVDKPKHSKDDMAKMGCLVDIGYDDKLRVTRGIVKPGEKVSVPKTPAQKRKATKERAERIEETGGISNSLAYRLSDQLTMAVRKTLQSGATGSDDAICLMIAALATTSSAIDLRLGNDHETFDAREKNDFVKYFDLARKHTASGRADLLMQWFSYAISLHRHDGGTLAGVLHPKKGDDNAPRAIVGLLDEKVYADAVRSTFDAADYFNSVAMPLIVEAVLEVMGKEHADKVAKLKKGEAVKFAIANLKGWVPPSLRKGSLKDMPK